VTSGASVRPAGVLRGALAILQRHPRRVIGAGAVVFGATAVVDVGVARLYEQADAAHPLLLVVVVMGTGLSLLGSTFYAGLLDRVVAEEERGMERRSLGHILRTLPYVRLIAADVLLTVGTIVLGAALLVPGLVFLTYFCLVGPVINMEDHGVVDAFRRSARLVRGHFRLVFLLVTLPILLEEQVMHTVEFLVHGEPALGVFAVNATVGAVVGSVVGLTEVTLAHRLAVHAPLAKAPVRLAPL